FRQTLLCHAGVALEPQPRAEQLARFWVASPARPVVEKPDLHSTEELEFRGQRGAAMSTNHPLAKAAVCGLGSLWPFALPFPELVRQAAAWLGREAPALDGPDPEILLLEEILLGMYSAGLLHLSLEGPAFVPEAGARPVASPLA